MIGDITIQKQNRTTECEYEAGHIFYSIENFTTKKETRSNFLVIDMTGTITSKDKTVFDCPISILMEFFDTLSSPEFVVFNRRIKFNEEDGYIYQYDFEIKSYEKF